MLARGDPVAVALDADFPDVRMPNLRLGETDAGDVIQYLQSEMDRLDAESAVTDTAMEHHEHGSHDGGPHRH
jgi:hypothetical protein